MQEFDDVTFNYPYPVQNSGGAYCANPHSFQQASSKPYPANGQVRSHNTYGYAHAVWSPWEVPKHQAHPMMPTSQIRSSTGHVAIPAMFHLPPPYPAETTDITPINRETDYWDLSSPQDNSSPSLSSDTTSSPSPRLPSPPAQQPLVIHQPRPYRRIPIISLTQLASACEEADNNRIQSDSALSPLPFEYLDFHTDPSPPGLHQSLSQYTLPGPASSQALKSQPGKTKDRSIFCSCGCMEHYICS